MIGNSYAGACRPWARPSSATRAQFHTLPESLYRSLAMVTYFGPLAAVLWRFARASLPALC